MIEMNHFFSYIYLVRLLTPIVNLVAMNKLLLLLTLAPCLAFGQLTYVPDDNFESYLETHAADGTPVSVGPASMGDGIANNDSVLTANISGVTILWVDYKNITDLTGIEDFAALTYLNCSNNQLTSLDVSNNTALTNLDCSYNQLTSLDVSGATALTTLVCYDNQLTSLDVSGATALTALVCYDNQLTSLDVSNNTALTNLDCWENQLTSLDVSNNTALTELGCGYNQLTCLKLKNGNNTNMGSMLAYYNPNLNCIEVDDEVWATANWANIDSQTSFSEDCNYPTPCDSIIINIPELPSPDKHLLTITDILGRTTLPKPNTLLFFIYDDGSVEKRIQLER